MSKTKRKVITKKVTVNLKDKEKEFFYSRGVQDALHTVLTQHKDLIQLKDLCTEYGKLFKYPHPTREWHLFRNKPQGADTSNGQDNSNPTVTDNDATKSTDTNEEVQLPEQETSQVTDGQEATS